MAENPGNTDRGTTRDRPALLRPARPLRARAADPRLAHLMRLAAQWKAELEDCLYDSKVETVHRIRTGTRRVEAMIDLLMREAAEENSALSEAAARWRRPLQKIRRAAGPVRDLDVHRHLIERFAGIEKSGEEGPAKQDEVAKQAVTALVGDAVEEQAARLDAWLKHARDRRAGDLSREIAKRLKRLDGLAARFAIEWQTRRGRQRRVRAAALAALEAFVQLSDEVPLLDASNLHDFRKGAKKARYMTEASGDDVQAKAVGRAIKKIQDVIGDWHDCLCLAEETHIALRDEGRELGTMLEAETGRSFEEAKRVTERMRGRLVGEWRAAGSHRIR